MSELYAYGGEVTSVFQLIGTHEDDITKSIAWALCNCPVFLNKIITNLLGIDVNPDTVRIKYQESEKDKGRTDLELTDDNLFYIIIEAKRGWILPGKDQLTLYSKRRNLVQSSVKHKAIVSMSECSDTYLEGYSTYKIACELTEMGVKTPAGKDKWHPSSVMSILQNEKYKGDALLQKTFTKDFLTHRLVVNNGEVPQYYVEGHHESIVTADQFDQVQTEILRRKGMQKYSGVGLFSSIIKCGECGSWYGAKVWHSNDKYRKVIYRCNNKYADGCKCKTPHINENELKELFIKAANELFSEREEILANTKVMMEMVCETDSLDSDMQDSITELNFISEQMQIAIAENSRVALDQDEYEKRYAELTARYEKAKAKYDDIAEQIESKKAKQELFKGFIRTLEKQDGITYEFDAGIWSSLVQEVIVKSKDDIRFIFKNGFEVKI